MSGYHWIVVDNLFLWGPHNSLIYSHKYSRYWILLGYTINGVPTSSYLILKNKTNTNEVGITSCYFLSSETES